MNGWDILPRTRGLQINPKTQILSSRVGGRRRLEIQPLYFAFGWERSSRAERELDVGLTLFRRYVLNGRRAGGTKEARGVEESLGPDACGFRNFRSTIIVPP